MGRCPPIFVFAPPRCFFGRKKLLFLAEKNVKICDFGQKKPLDFGEDLFFLEITCFWSEKTLKLVISARKSLRKSAKTFAPLTLFLPPRSREAGDDPVCSQKNKIKTSPKKQVFLQKNDLQNFKDSKNTAVLEPRTGNFRGLEALRPRTSKCVLEDSTSVNGMYQ